VTSVRTFFCGSRILPIQAALLLLFAAGSALADDSDHFRKFPVPPDEARILALAGIREARCDYEIHLDSKSFSPTSPGHYQNDFELFAELYHGTTRIGRYRLPFAVNGFTDPSVPLKGIFSFGWSEEKHELTAVIDNGQIYSPWSASVVLQDFSYFDYHFFEDSAPEKRRDDYGGDEMNVYPVVGICGYRDHKMNFERDQDATAFLGSCERAGAQHAIIVYLYKENNGGVPLKYYASSWYSRLAAFFPAWSKSWLGLALLAALIVFLFHRFLTQARRNPKKSI
jgi:hypothetical protein